jgi:hypothetical protein
MSEISQFKSKIKNMNPSQLVRAAAVCIEKVNECKVLKGDIADLANDPDPKVRKEHSRVKEEIDKNKRDWEDLLKEIKKSL